MNWQTNERGALSLGGTMLAAASITSAYLVMNSSIIDDLRLMAKFEHASEIDSIEHSVMADVFRRMGGLAEELGMGLCTMTNYLELREKLHSDLGSDRFQLQLITDAAPIGTIPQEVLSRCALNTVNKVQALDPSQGGGEPQMINICAERGLYACFMVSPAGADPQPFLATNHVLVEMRYFLQDLDSGLEIDFAAYNDNATRNRQGYTYYALHFAKKTGLASQKAAAIRTGILRGRSKPLQEEQ